MKRNGGLSGVNYCHPVSSAKRLLHLLDGAQRSLDGAAGHRNRTCRIGVGEQHAAEWLARGGDELGVSPRRGHEHGMPAAVDVHFDRIGVRAGQQLLPIAQDVSGQIARALFGEQLGPLGFAQRRVEREDIVLLPVSRADCELPSRPRSHP